MNRQGRSYLIKMTSKVFCTLLALTLGFAMNPIGALGDNYPDYARTLESATDVTTDTYSSSLSPLITSDTASVDDTLLVTYRGDAEIDKVVEDSGVQVSDTQVIAADVAGDDIAAVKVVGEQAEPEDIALLESNPDVESVVPDTIYYLNRTVDDPLASKNCYLKNCGVSEAWDTVTTSKKVTVAMIDTGIDTASENRHADLENNVDFTDAYDAVTGTGLIEEGFEDIIGHGTATAGCMSAEADNGIGIAGSSYDARILPINVFNVYASYKSGGYIHYDCYTDAAWIVKAYQRILELKDSLNIKVVNMSLGGPSNNTALQTVINEATSKGILTVASAGNNGTSTMNYPACCDNVISVGGVTAYSKHAEFSNHNLGIDLCAPAVDVLTTHEEWTRVAGTNSFRHYYNSYAYKSGTSFAAPIVSGIAALLFTENNSLTPALATETLEESATDLGASGRDDYYGYGEVNAGHALKVLTGSDMVVHALKKTLQVAATCYARGYAIYECSGCGYRIKLPTSDRKAVVLQSLTGKPGAILVRWEKAAGIGVYCIYFRRVGYPTWHVRKASRYKTAYTLEKLAKGKRYYVKIRACTYKDSMKIFSSYSKTGSRSTTY